MTEDNLFEYRSHEAKVEDMWRRWAMIKPKSPVVPRNAPITSQMVAAKLAESDPFKHKCERLLQAVCNAGDDGIIDDQLIVTFHDWAHSSVTSTMARLREWGLIKHGPDMRRTRRNHLAMVNRVR
jgi:hypothetical protein